MAERAKAQKFESPGSHAAYISQPENVAAAIERALSALPQAK